MKNLIVVGLLALGVSFSSQAGVLVEPFVGSTFSGELERSGVDGSTSGTVTGARLGWQTLGLMFGLDYRIGSLDVDYDGNTTDDALDRTVTSVFVGYDFPILLRAWYTHNISNVADRDNTNGAEISGSGNTIGLGYKIIPFFSLNFEIANYEYDEQTLNGNKTDVDYKGSHYLLSVSFPISL